MVAEKTGNKNNMLINRITDKNNTIITNSFQVKCQCAVNLLTAKLHFA